MTMDTVTKEGLITEAMTPRQVGSQNGVLRALVELIYGVYTERATLDQAKELHSLLYDCDGSYINDIHKGLTIRKALQLVGTDFGRKYWPNIWLDCFTRDYDKVTSNIVLVTDVRFPNEAETIRKLGGKVLKVSRYEDSQEVSHVSEKPLTRDLIDFILNNNGTLEDLKSTVHNLTKLIG
jgi:hypothetical protein